MTRCLLVDDDAALRTELSEYLQGFGFEVTAVASGVAMRQCLAAPTFCGGASGRDAARRRRGQPAARPAANEQHTGHHVDGAG